MPLHYDSLLAKLIVHAEDRAKAIERMLDALARFSIDGVGTTLPFLKFAVRHPDFVGERMNTELNTPEPTTRPSTITISSVAVDSRLTNRLELPVNRIARDLRGGDDEMMRAENSTPR